MNTVIINKGQELTIKGYYREETKSSYSTPGTAASFEIRNVFVQNIEITDLLHELNIDWSVLEDAAIESMQNIEYTIY